MPFPTGCGKLTFSGIHGTDEIWSFGFHCDAIAITGTQMNALATAAAFFLDNDDSHISSACALTEVKYAQLDELGRYVGDGTPVIKIVDPPAAGGSGPSYLPQCTTVVGLVTAVPRGLAHAGRFYMPPTALQAENSGLISESDQSGLLGAARSFLQDVNAALSPANVIVASSKGEGAFHEVTGVRMGRVIDTQRRRRNALPESYVTAAL